MTSLVSKALADPQSSDTLMLPEVSNTTGELARVLKLRQAQDGAQLRTLATAWYQGKLTEFTWVQTQPSLLLQSGQLIRFSAGHPAPSDSMVTIPVRDVRLAPNVDPDVFLLDTVPNSWLPEAKANPGHGAAEPSPAEDLRGMWGSLSRPMRAWWNAIFWFQPMRLYWFLCAPASMNHHHARKHGLFIHSVDCAQRAITAAWHDDLVNTDVLMLAALLHDLGKADKYVWNETKKCWSLSDRGALMGHRLTTLDWMSAARGLLSDNDSPTEMEALAVYHAINASNAPEWVGLRSPRTPEAFYLASVDGLSGQCDLIRSHAIPNAVRGRYLLFLRRLDDLHTLEENKANRLKRPMERRIFPEGDDARGRPYDSLRWSRFKNEAPSEMFVILGEHVFPFLRTLGGDGSTYAHHMKDARFTIPTAALLAKVVDLLDAVPMEDRDTKGDLYEYMLGKIASAGQNGQFRTPRHIIQLMVEMTAPTPQDVICDPASGTCGFLVAAGEYLRQHHTKLFHDAKLNQHFNRDMFHGYDFDNTMLRIGSMNMLLHGVENPAITYRDSLAQEHGSEEGRYSLVLANPPFAGSLDYENTAKDLLQVVKTKKTELLFLALFLRLLKPGGRAAVIVPDGVLFGSSTAHKTLRRMLVEEQKLDGIVSLPGGVFKPYAGVSTAILFFTKTNSGGTDKVWFYDIQADGWSLDDKRQPLLTEDKLGLGPAQNGRIALSEAEHVKNNLPDVLARWAQRDGAELERPRTAQSFCVDKADIAAIGYDLSLNRYKEVVHAQIQHRPPSEILAELVKLEDVISQGMKELQGMLK